jgi:hypothetical protein
MLRCLFVTLVVALAGAEGPLVQLNGLAVQAASEATEKELRQIPAISALFVNAASCCYTGAQRGFFRIVLRAQRPCPLPASE